MLDIFEDSCESLDLDRIKDKIRSIWSKIIVADYNNQYGNMSDDDEKYITLEQFMQDNQLYFPGDNKPEDEVTSIIDMLEDMFSEKEELDPIKGEGKAPTYGGSQLKANNDGRKVESTSYEFEFTSTKTPNDSKSVVKSGTYNKPSGGRMATRKDSQVKRSYKPMIEKLVDELLSLDERRRSGYREYRQRI